jgi:hypothetical protein
MIKIKDNRFYGHNILRPTNFIFSREKLNQFKETISNVQMDF